MLWIGYEILSDLDIWLNGSSCIVEIPGYYNIVLLIDCCPYEMINQFFNLMDFSKSTKMYLLGENKGELELESNLSTINVALRLMIML